MEDVDAMTGGPGDPRAHGIARLMYASLANVQGSIYAEMERIRASAVRHNEPIGVATALLYQSGWFVQWKEGSGEALLRTMDRVEADSRHHSLRIVHSSRGPRLLAGPWSMAIVQCDESPGDMAHRVSLLRHDLEQGKQYSPPAVWRRLSTPLRHPGAMHQAEPDAFQRVLVCAAEGMGSFALVNWLGSYHGEEVVHRRFAGAHDLDVGTDYVDFAEDGRVLRVIAMARHGLSVPLTRAFLPDYSHVVLLLSGNLEHDVSLVLRVAQVCAGILSPPILLGIAPEAADHQKLSGLVKNCGLSYLSAESDSEYGKFTWTVIERHLAGWQHRAISNWPVVPLRPQAYG